MKAKILIVEDDPFIALSLSSLLKSNDFCVIDIKDNAEEAWESCLTNKPDLVLLDIHLVGDKNGTWVGQQIKEKLPFIKYIYLTAFNDEDTIKQISKTEPELYLTKPFNKKVLLSNIELILKKNKANFPFELIDGKKKHLLESTNICFFNSEGNYVNIVFNNRKKLVVRGKLLLIKEKLMNPNFIRVHQSYIVNMATVSMVGRNYLYIDDVKIPISNPYKEKALSVFEILSK